MHRILVIFSGTMWQFMQSLLKKGRSLLSFYWLFWSWLGEHLVCLCSFSFWCFLKKVFLTSRFPSQWPQLQVSLTRVLTVWRCMASTWAGSDFTYLHYSFPWFCSGYRTFSFCSQYASSSSSLFLRWDVFWALSLYVIHLEHWNITRFSYAV
jgi:hypothetical protein